MNQFLKQLGKFFIIPIIAIILLNIVATFILGNSSYYKIESHINEVYVGDSHIRQSVVDSLLINGQNIALNSESFYFTYYRLKKIFESKNNIKTVYLGFSYHSLSDYYDERIYGKFSNSISPKYFYLLPFSEQVKIFYYNREHNYLKKIIKNSIKPILNNSNFGGYSNNFVNTKSRKSSIEKRINFQYYTDKNLNEFSKINLRYLEKIIALSKKHKFDLIIIKTPLDSYYKSKIPIEYINKYDDTIKKYNLNLIDFENLFIEESLFIPDGDHLSRIGSIKMTKELIKASPNP